MNHIQQPGIGWLQSILLGIKKYSTIATAKRNGNVVSLYPTVFIDYVYSPLGFHHATISVTDASGRRIIKQTVYRQNE